MNEELLKAVIEIAPSITTSSMLLLAWMLERRRADRLEAIALNRQEQKERMEILKQGEV